MKIIKENISESAYYTAYILDNMKDIDIDRKHPIVVICPGGGYIDIAERETEPVALAYLYRDYHAVVLNYTTASTGNAKFPQSALDLSKMLEILWNKKEEWQIDIDNIILVGFSAGAHLVLEYAADWNKEWLKSKSQIEPEKRKPAMVVAGYPLCDYIYNNQKGKSEKAFNEKMEMLGCSKYEFMCKANRSLLGEDDSEEMLKRVSPVYQVTKDMPPVFLWGTAEDDLVFIGNTLRMGLALEEQKIPFEMHVFQKGIHGLSMATKAAGNMDILIDEDAAQWFELSVKFIERNKKRDDQ